MTQCRPSASTPPQWRDATRRDGGDDAPPSPKKNLADGVAKDHDEPQLVVGAEHGADRARGRVADREAALAEAAVVRIEVEPGRDNTWRVSGFVDATNGKLHDVSHHGSNFEYCQALQS